jgi:hypothetical protein
MMEKLGHIHIIAFLFTSMTSWAMPHGHIGDCGVCVRARLPDSGNYFGPTDFEGRAHGMGFMHFSNGDRLNGTWVHGVLDPNQVIVHTQQQAQNSIITVFYPDGTINTLEPIPHQSRVRPNYDLDTDL